MFCALHYIHANDIHVCKSYPITGTLFILFANLGVSQVQQGAQLFGVKMNLDFLVARGAEFLFNEIDNGTHRVNVFVMMGLMRNMIIVFVFKHTSGHDIIADGLGNKVFIFT